MTDRLTARVRWLPVVVVAGIILVAAVTHTDGVGRALGPLGLVGADKYLHVLGFGALAVTLAVALAAEPVDRLVAVVVLATVGYGLLVELAQLPIPYRSFSLLDLLADAIGATAVALTYRVVHRLRRPRSE